MVIKGILVQTKGPVGVVMTPDGRFVRVLLRKNHRTLGQEVTGIELKFPSLLQGGAVASVLILVCIIGLWAKMMPASAAAYVALDINPSLELAVDNKGTVMKATGLDEDGRQLLKKVPPEKLEVYQAVELLVAGAARYHYLNDTNNVVLATVTPARENTTVVDEEKLAATVNHTVTALNTPVKVITERATVEEHKLAGQKGVSVGRYLIHQGSSKQGARISLDEVKNKGLGQLEKEKGIEIQHVLPHAKFKGQEDLKPVNHRFKQMPPGQITKEQRQQRLPNNKPLQTNQKKQDHGEDQGNQEGKEDKKQKDEDETEQRRYDRRHSPSGPPQHTQQIKDSALDKAPAEKHPSHPSDGTQPGKPDKGPKGKEKEDKNFINKENASATQR
ncbi:hypothetical protein SAMN02745133_01757 [Desulforamulus putei DSM 12395]|uniref:RsgI N-terminal anti-sigma domain-containing protein n=1 Tax=Desulforamulus putei DSM 12395 TaxID=1121429 RepID=A0A1M4YNN1_9FIRM|nr:hypothetical protein SAMN02745133_01757 [Desulforamulus putei DSM 12395]